MKRPLAEITDSPVLIEGRTIVVVDHPALGTMFGRESIPSTMIWSTKKRAQSLLINMSGQLVCSEA
jgi:hypothetical protein